MCEKKEINMSESEYVILINVLSAVKNNLVEDIDGSFFCEDWENWNFNLSKDDYFKLCQLVQNLRG